jgi:hypothetical protein
MVLTFQSESEDRATEREIRATEEAQIQVNETTHTHQQIPGHGYRQITTPHIQLENGRGRVRVFTGTAWRLKACGDESATHTCARLSTLPTWCAAHNERESVRSEGRSIRRRLAEPEGEKSGMQEQKQGGGKKIIIEKKKKTYGVRRRETFEHFFGESAAHESQFSAAESDITQDQHVSFL